MKKLLILIFALLTVSILRGNILTVTNTNNTGLGSLRHKVGQATDGDTVMFAQSLIANGSDSIVLNSEIYIGVDLTIIGLQNTTDTLYISGGGLNQIFVANYTNYLVLDSLVMVNGYYPSIWLTTGGAVVIDDVDSIKIENCIIRNSRTDGNGGGLFIRHKFKQTNCRIDINNSIISENRAKRNGGGIMIFIHQSVIRNVVCNITNSIIRSNVSEHSNNPGVPHTGGGLFMQSSSGAKLVLNVENSIFDNNEGQIAGAISLHSQHGWSHVAHCEANILNSSITRNKANSCSGICCGAAITSKIKIEKSSIIENVALNPTGYGGAAVGASKIKIKNSTIVDNTVENISTNSFANAVTAGPNWGTPSKVEVSSSIVSQEFGKDIRTVDSTMILSDGYNIFEDSILYGAVLTDQMNVDSISLNLGDLAYNGGLTYSKEPLFPSVSINQGNPLDTSSAQNVQIHGIRDVGAAESCRTTYTDVHTTCFPFLWIDGITYYSDTNGVEYVLPNALGCDSVVTLDLSFNTIDSGVTVIGHTMIAQSSTGSFQWIDCNTMQPINGATNDTFLVTQSGNYALEIIDNGCIDTSSCYTFTSVGIEHEDIGHEIYVYPNPTKNQLKIKVNKNDTESIEYNLVSINGMVVRSQKSNGSFSFDVSDLPNGVYMLEVKGNQKNKIFKVFISR
ncbi:T9SS type A sorting domain-containing protein [bacterium SCSIO 12643]|nr:T9SS type A sorting domain-containing protein [bacterium SCSIO 12643]